MLKCQEKFEKVTINYETRDQCQQCSLDQAANYLIIRMIPLKHATKANNVQCNEQAIHHDEQVRQALTCFIFE